MNFKNKKAYAVTLGCRLNQADTALLFSRLNDAGFEIIKNPKTDTPDLIIINTCTVTGNAASKSRQAARQLKRKYPLSCILVTGCDCNKAAEQWKQEECVDIIMPNNGKKNIIQHLEQWFKQREDLSNEEKINKLTIPANTPKPDVFKENIFAAYPFRQRAFLKIQEGCNAFCTYCIVPYVRGPERSRDYYEVINDAKNLIKQNYKEIIITGVNISTYRDKNRGINELLKDISDIPGDFRIRLSSMEPHQENFALVDTIKDYNKICPFLHVPLQSGSNDILNKMGRKYKTQDFFDFIEYARTSIPGVHLGTDIISGFPGETDELFEETCSFLKKANFANIHSFRFSPREGTPAASFENQIPHRIIKNRAAIIQKIADESKILFIKSQIGQNLTMLIEKIEDNGSFRGWTENYIKVIIQHENLEIGTFHNFTLIEPYLSK